MTRSLGLVAPVGAVRADVRRPSAPRRIPAWWATALALPIVVAAVVQLALTSDHRAEPVASALYGSWLVAGPGLIGLAWWRRRPTSGYGPLLAALGLAALPFALASANAPAVFVLGGLGESAYFSLLLFLCIAYPSGRLAPGVDRFLFGAFASAAALFAVPPLLFQPELEIGVGPLGVCDPSCPANPVALADVPALVAVTTLLALALATIATAGLGGRLGWRLHRATRPQRRELAAVAAFAFPFFPAVLLLCVARLVGASDSAVAAISWLFTASVILFSVGFAVALARAELFAAAAFRRLLGELTRRPAAPRWRDAVADALDDPSLRLGYWDAPHRLFREADGRPLAIPPSAGRHADVIEYDGLPVAALTTDGAVADQPELLRAAEQATLVAVRAGRLEDELRRSRRVAVDAADSERRRIQRDLHDSAQQRLVALRVHLHLAAEDAEGGTAGHEALDTLGEEIDLVIQDLRRVAHGQAPAALDAEGVVVALRTACRHTGLPLRIVDVGVGRRARAVETALFFCCLEGLQNAAKHAGVSARAVVRVGSWAEGAWFSVEDDGVGFDAATTHGAGLANIRARIEALDGILEIESAPNRGTRIMGWLRDPPEPD